MNAPLLPASTHIWVLSDGKIGDETQCFGIAEALGCAAQRRLIAPRRFYTWLMPYGPIDPREKHDRAHSPLAAPFPDIAIAAGRRTVAYLRHLKRISQGQTFTVFVKDPYVGCSAADVIWVPEHDRLRGANVITSETPAHRIGAKQLAAARAAPDPRLAGLPPPRLAMILGGPSKHHRYSQADAAELASIAQRCSAAGFTVTVTGSRRTPPSLLNRIKAALNASSGPHFIWDGSGDNPYVSLLALADAILVTGDSVNMMAEAAATGAPVHIYEPHGGHRKMTAYIDHLVSTGAVRRWTGQIAHWNYTPINATPRIASDIARRYLAWHKTKIDG